jgi:hypothetical protein
MTHPNDSSPATDAARQELALLRIETTTRRYLKQNRPIPPPLPSEEVALIKTVYGLARDGLGRLSRDAEAAAICTKCGKPHGRTKPWNGDAEDLCDACEKARVEEIHRVAEHYRLHPDECCCHTYLARSCCMAPIHGDVYRALCIENGERFVTDFRASNRTEAMELGREHAAGWGGECVSVRKLPPNMAT